MFTTTVCGGLTLVSKWSTDPCAHILSNEGVVGLEWGHEESLRASIIKHVWRSARKLVARPRHWFSIAAVAGVMCFQKQLNIILSREQADCWDLGPSSKSASSAKQTAAENRRCYLTVNMNNYCFPNASYCKWFISDENTFSLSLKHLLHSEVLVWYYWNSVIIFINILNMFLYVYFLFL